MGAGCEVRTARDRSHLVVITAVQIDVAAAIRVDVHHQVGGTVVVDVRQCGCPYRIRIIRKTGIALDFLEPNAFLVQDGQLHLLRATHQNFLLPIAVPVGSPQKVRDKGSWRRIRPGDREILSEGENSAAETFEPLKAGPSGRHQIGDAVIVNI